MSRAHTTFGGRAQAGGSVVGHYMDDVVYLCRRCDRPQVRDGLCAVHLHETVSNVTIRDCLRKRSRKAIEGVDRDRSRT